MRELSKSLLMAAALAAPAMAAMPEVVVPTNPMLRPAAAASAAPVTAVPAAAVEHRIQDPFQPGQTTIGELGRGPAGTAEDTARGWLAGNVLGEKLDIQRGLTTIDVHDGTPVRLVRMRVFDGREVAVCLGQGTRVIGVSVSPGDPAELMVRRPRLELGEGAASRPAHAFRKLPDVEVKPGGLAAAAQELATEPVTLTDLAPEAKQLDGRWFATRRARGERLTVAAESFLPAPGVLSEGKAITMNPEFLEVNAYHHASRGRAELAAYGAQERWDRIVGRLEIVVDVTHTPSGRELVGNCFYTSVNRGLHFAKTDTFPSAAEGSIVIRTLGHAAWHALAGSEPDKRGMAEEFAVYEGFADAYAALVTGDPVIGRWWLPAGGDAPRNTGSFRDHGRQKSAGPHGLGLVYANLLREMGQGRDRETWRRLVLGGIQLAPHPITPASLVSGLLLADRYFHEGRNIEKILAAARARGVPFREVK